MIMTSRLEPIRLPDLIVDSQLIRVSTWLIELGEVVIAGDALVELLVKGKTFDVEAPVSGKLQRINCFEDDVAVAGDILGWIETNSPTDPVSVE